MVSFSQLTSRLRSCFVAPAASGKRFAYGAAVIGTTLIVAPFPAAGLFGIGDIVFDPTSYATLAKIWSSDASTYAKVTEPRPDCLYRRPSSE